MKKRLGLVVQSLTASACLLGLLLCQTASAQQYAMSNLWTIAVSNTLPFFNGDNNTRGLAYNPATDHLLVPSRGGAQTNIHILDATTGSLLGTLPFDKAIVDGGTFPINMIGVTEDGVIYVGNLTTDSTGLAGPFKLYRWASETAQPQLVYIGDPSGADLLANNRRFGDSLILRGTGANTQILLGTVATNVALLRTTDGVNFNATKIPTDVASGDVRFGIAWGAGNTFWAKQGTSNLKRITLDLVANTGTVTASVPLAAGPGGPLGIDLDRNLLAIVDTANSVVTTTHKLRLFDISNPSAPLQVDATQSFPVKANNGNLVGAVSIRNGKLFALDTNNGILAYYLQGGIFYPVTISSQPSSVTLWEGAQNWTFSVTNSGTPPLYYQWRANGADIAGATNPSYTLAPVGISNNFSSYSVIVTNNSSVRTSSTAVVSIQQGNASGQVSNIWDVAAGTRPYLTTDYKAYGVAINPLTTNVIVVTRANPTNMIAVLDMQTGAHKHYIDYSLYGLPPGQMNKVTVADDGVVFVCNISTDTAANTFKIYGFQDDSPTPLIGYLFDGDPGLDVNYARVLPATVGWGANLDARGGGMDTEILVGAGKYSATTYDANAVSILKYNASSLLYSTPIIITNLPVSNNNFRFGICWGAGDSFWAKGLANLMYIEFDRATGLGGVVRSYPASGSRSVPSSVTAMAYDAATSLIVALQNGSPPSPVSVPFYDVRDPLTGPLWVDQELFGSYNADIEFQGSVSFEKGYAVALGVNNGLKAFKIDPSFTSSLPVIVRQPANGTWFQGTSPSLSVVADSFSTLNYQWYKGTELLSGKTNASMTITNIQLSQAGDYWVRVSNTGGSRDTVNATLVVIPSYNTAQMTNIWSALPGTRPYLNTGYFEYGMAFNPANSNLLVASYVSTNNPRVIIGVLDALTGADKHVLNTDVSIVTGGNRWVNKIGVADDGVVYAANRTTASVTDPLKVYRWANDQPSTIPTVAFSGDPFPNVYPNKLVGWTMDVRGAGVNTEILLSTSASNVLSVLKTADGVTFTPNDFVVTGAPADFARLGICFGVGNTFWVKTWSGSLYLVQYDLVAKTGTILKTYNTTQFPSTITTLAYNDTLKFLAGAALDDQKNVQLFSVADTSVPPVLLDQEIFPTYNASIEANGALDFGGNTYLFGMNENNGIMAFLINPNYQPPSSSFKILNVSLLGGSVTLTWEAQSGTTYQVKYADTITGAWNNAGSTVTANTNTASYTETAVPNRFYRVVTQ